MAIAVAAGSCSPPTLQGTEPKAATSAAAPSSPSPPRAPGVVIAPSSPPSPSPGQDLPVLSGPHLAPGSNPAVLPAPILIADRDNGRLLIVDPMGRVRWRFPRAGDLPAHVQFDIPDDAFFSPDGTRILATQEDMFQITMVGFPSHQVLLQYGRPWIHGSSPGYLWNPDDAMITSAGPIISADIKNCRIILLPVGGRAPSRVFGGHGCAHDPPGNWGSPNGAFPLSDGNWLVTEINGDWVDELDVKSGQVLFSTHPPGVAYPSDTNEVRPGVYLVADYSYPGQLVMFDRKGSLLWRYRPLGAQALNHPSLALPLPGGYVLCNDDRNQRVIVVDPRTDRVVWQYGVTGVPGSAPGYLSNPDGVDVMAPFSLAARFAPRLPAIPIGAELG